MRDQETIKRELDSAREHLDRDLSELRHVVADKIDVKKQAKVAARRVKAEVIELGKRVRRSIDEQPWMTIGFLLGVAALITGSILLARSRAA
jgi:ElaB/YqjD/DUF883 family membrane-anchored ribosome-binding protein